MTLPSGQSRNPSQAVFFHNATIFTPEALSSRGPPASSIELAGGNIVSVGHKNPTESPVVKIDLQGALVFPGFIDAHTHLASYGASLSELSLQGLLSAEEVYKRVAEQAKHKPSGEWILGRGWDESQWSPPEPLSSVILSRICPNHPVFLLRIDGHIAVLNNLGFQRLSLDPSRYPDGMLREVELDFARAHFRGGPESRAEAILRGATEALSLGITCIHEMAHYEDLLAYRHLYDNQQLPLRVYLIPYYDAWVSGRKNRTLPVPDDHWLWSRGVKFFADGSLGARTALLSEAYADAPGEHGRFYENPDDIARRIREVIAAGFQPVIHCIGDAAIDWALSVLESARPAATALRSRLEHFELPLDDHISRLKSLGGIASMQPNFIGQWGFPGGLYEQRLGSDRFMRMNPLWKIHHNEVPMCLGSDTMPMSPAFGIRSAVVPPFRFQRLKPGEAVHYYTAGGAYASFSEDWLGALAPGFAADLVLMDAMPDNLGRVLATIVSGNLAFFAPDSPITPDHFAS